MVEQQNGVASVKRKRKLNETKTLDSKVKKLKSTTPKAPKEPKQDTKENIDTPITKTDITLDNETKYPILKNKELIDKFMKVQLNNNQKGRIRQALSLKYQGTPAEHLPDVIHAHIQGMLKNSEDLLDSKLRKIRILYNMLRTALQHGKNDDVKSKKKKRKRIRKDKADKENEDEKENKEEKEGEAQEVKQKGPKRYVAFLGSLPLDIDEQKIRDHFIEINAHITTIRIPKIKEGKRAAIAYLELSNEPSYELALSKHHSMLGNKRINVLYSIQKNSKISNAEAKSKAAKLIALQKSGKLIGSIPLGKKRSQRRLKMKKARAKEAQS